MPSRMDYQKGSQWGPNNGKTMFGGGMVVFRSDEPVPPKRPIGFTANFDEPEEDEEEDECF